MNGPDRSNHAGPLIGMQYPVAVRPRNLGNRNHTGNTNSGHMK